MLRPLWKFLGAETEPAAHRFLFAICLTLPLQEHAKVTG
jgi:hypothetical protein